MVRRESGFGSRCCGLRHGELPVVRLQFRCRGGVREVQLYGQRAAMITFRSFSANVMVVLSRALIAAVHESASWPSRHIASLRDLGRFQGEADINGRVRAGRTGSRLTRSRTCLFFRTAHECSSTMQCLRIASFCFGTRAHHPQAGVTASSICENQDHHGRENQQCLGVFSEHWPR